MHVAPRVRIHLCQRRLQTAIHRYLEGLCLAHHATPVDGHKVIEPPMARVIQLPFALAGQQVAKFPLLIVVHLLVAQGEHLLIGQKVYRHLHRRTI